MQWCRL
jgi:hypothetical protein